MGRSTTDRTPRSAQVRNENDDGIIDQATAIHSVAAARIVVLNGEVNENTISSTIVQMLYLANQDRAPIHLVVSTYGGSVDEMFSLYDTIKFLPCPVHTVGLGKVMSSGVLLLASGEKGTRQIGRNARVMLHPVHGAASGTVFQQINSVSELKRMHDQMVKALVRETKMTKTQVDQIMKKGHDHFLTASEAIKLGIVDRYIDT